MLSRLGRWCRGLVSGRGLERALDDELRACVDILAAEKMANGVPELEARRQARAELGGVEAVKAHVRDGWPGARLDTWVWDARYALRGLRRHRTFALTSVAVIALCVALTASVFAVFDALVLRTLPAHRPDRLVLINEVRPDLPVGTSALTAPLLDLIRQRTSDAAQIFGFSGNTLGIGNGPSVRKGRVFGVTGDYFEALDAKPALGRLFGRNETGPVAVISDAYWRSEFDADPHVIGRTYQLGVLTAAIVGVATPDFVGTQPDSAWDAMLPLVWYLRARKTPDSQIYAERQEAGARLRDGVSREQFEAHLNAVWPDIVKAAAPPGGNPDEWAKRRGRSVVVKSLAGGLSYLKSLDPGLARAAAMTFALAVVVCAAACLTLALLVVARAVRQRHEMSVMMAIGGSRVRALRPFVIETLAIATLGGAAGLGLALWWVKVGATFAPGDWRIAIDGSAAAIGGTIALVAALTIAGFGALLLSRTSMATAFRQDARMSNPHVRLRTLLLTTQFAVAVVLLHYALVYVADVSRLLRVDAGFTVEGLKAFQVAGILPYRPLDQRDVRNLDAAIRQIPGVEAASLAGIGAILPFSYLPDASQPVSAEGTDTRATTRCAYPGYLGVLGVDILGRDLNWTGTEAVVTANLAARLFGGEPALGHAITASNKTWQIVGVAGDVTFGSPRAGRTPMVFVPCLESYPAVSSGFAQTIVIRSPRTLLDLEPDIRGILAGFKTYHLFDSFLERDVLADAIKSERMLAMVSGTAGTLIVVMTGIGLYGFCAYVFSLRARDLAIRTALGATPRQIQTAVVSETIKVLFFGTALGSALTLVARRIAAHAGLELIQAVPLHLAGAVLAMAVVTIAAVAIPTRRAVRLDVAKTLRLE